MSTLGHKEYQNLINLFNTNPKGTLVADLLVSKIAHELSTPEGLDKVYSSLNQLYQSIRHNTPFFLRLKNILLPQIDGILQHFLSSTSPNKFIQLLKVTQIASLSLSAKHNILLNSHLSCIYPSCNIHSLVLIFSLMMKQDLFTCNLSTQIQKHLISQISCVPNISMQTLVGVQMSHALTPLLSQEIERYACDKFSDPEYLNLSLIYMLSLIQRQRSYTQVNLYTDLMAQIDGSID